MFQQNNEVDWQAPLAARMRPRTLQEYVGQQHIMGEGKLLNRAITADRITSVILYGPPGVGKTTLALCIAQHTQSHFERINAVASNVDEMRKIIAGARQRRMMSKNRTILFIDEIHRFNKAQQDVLMPDIEEGIIILVGATVFNPFFSLTPALLSRSVVLELRSHNPEDVTIMLRRALMDQERGLGQMKISITDEALDFLSKICDGDMRKALNSLEIAALTTPANQEGNVSIDLLAIESSIQRKHVNYDTTGDGHYDTISAFIKSMRGSDPDAAIYWLAKMIYAGEDPRFIARRMVICAAEDVGNADPQALVLANSALQAAEFVGMPEARIILAQAAIYIACAPKSNAAYKAIDMALEDVKHKRIQEVPVHLKDAHYQSAQKLGHGKGYQYAHDFKDGFVAQEYMPRDIAYYQPTEHGYEAKITQRLNDFKARKKNSKDI